jgi:hypothetical protein
MFQRLSYFHGSTRKLFALDSRVATLEHRPPPWHNLSDTAAELSSAADADVEEIV